jgi:hypothetical protein
MISRSRAFRQVITLKPVARARVARSARASPASPARPPRPPAAPDRGVAAGPGGIRSGAALTLATSGADSPIAVSALARLPCERPEACAASYRRQRRRRLKWDGRRLRLPERCLGR